MQSSYSSTDIYHSISCKPSASRSFELFLGAETKLQFIKHQLCIPKGVILFTEGENSKGIYLIVSGRLMLTADLSKDARLITHIVGAQQVLGLSASILGAANECTAEAVESCQVEFIERRDLLHLMCEHNEVCLRLARLVSDDCRRIFELRRLFTILNV